MPNDTLSPAEMEELKQIAQTLPTGHPAQRKVNLLLSSQPTQFEKERTGGQGVMGTLKSMIPKGPDAPITSKEFWLGKPGSTKFDPTGPGTAYSDLTRELPPDLPMGEGPINKAVGRGIYRGASLFAPLAGISPEGMEEASGRGDTAGVATQAAVPAAAALAGPLMARVPGAAGRLTQRVLRGPGGTSEVAVNPATIAARELEAKIPRSEPPGARRQMQMDIGKQSADAIRRMPPQAAPPPPGATMSSAPGGVATLPAAPPTAAPSMSGVPAGGQPLPLAARTAARTGAAELPTRRLILPGEEIDPMARSSAGSAAQATEGDLRRLAQMGDESARQELIRRRLPMGQEGRIDYSKAPLPKGTLGERIGQAGESEMEARIRGAAGENPTLKSIRRQFAKQRKVGPPIKATPGGGESGLPDITVEESQGPGKLDLQRRMRERAAAIRAAGGQQ